ncbi:MAG: DNA primase [Bacteroidia bacterium]
MKIPPQTVDEIYAATDIVEVVGDYVSLRKKGVNYWALSPFVKERTPSFSVNPVKGIYKCFSSGKGGNTVSFLMEMEGYSYVEALQHLAKKYNIALPEEEEKDENYQQNKTKHESLYIVNQFAADFFHQELLQTEAGQNIGLSYFKERGILEHTIQTFQLGYAPAEWEKFSKIALEKQYNADYLVELGLASRSEKTGNLIDRFRDRVMFPITNVMGKVVGFGGRILGNKEKEAKYINSPESEIYHKSQVLFGLSLAKNAIRNKDLCILSEGYMDVITMYQSGIHHVVASSGTSLTEEQARLIRRFTKNVLLIYDGDEPGIKAAMRGIDILIAEGIAVKSLILPDNHDPDSFLKAFGLNAFETCIAEKSLDFMDFKLQRMQANKKFDSLSPREQAEFIHQISTTLALLPDKIEQQMYIRNTAAKLTIQEDLLLQAMGDAKKERQKQEQREMKRNQIQPKAEIIEMRAFETLDTASQEKELFRVLLNYYDKEFQFTPDGQEEAIDVTVTEYFMVEMEGMSFENPIFEEIKGDIFACFHAQITFDLHKYLVHPEPQVSSLVSELLTLTHSLSENWVKYDALAPSFDKHLFISVYDPMLYYKYHRILKMLKEAKESIRLAIDEAAENEALEKYMYLLQKKQLIEKKKGIEGAIRVEDVR